MNTRITIPLLFLFFAGMVALWWADWSGVPTEAERLRRSGRVLPELLDVELDEIHRLVISGGDSPITLERQGPKRWQVVEPFDALADTSQVEVLLRNLKNLRRLEEAGKIEGEVARFGFNPPQRTIFLYGENLEKPLASLEIGTEIEDQRFVRPSGQAGIEVADAARLDPALLPATHWRERGLFDIYSYDIRSLVVEGPERSLRVELDKGRWRIEVPIQAPADPGEINGLLADLATLEAVSGDRGFVADNVKDLSPYGLDRPTLSITLTPAGTLRDLGTDPQTAHIGDRLAEVEEPTFYARREGEDDVLLVRSRALAELGLDPNLVRSRRVADFDSGAVAFLEIEAGDVKHLLSKSSEGWRVVQPVPGPADLQTLGELLNALNNLQAGDFLPAERVKDAGLDPPSASFRVWLVDGEAQEKTTTAADSQEPVGAPDVELHLGRFDANSQSLFARTKGDDRTILPLPASARNLIPQGPLAYRDRTLNEIDPARISRLELFRDGQTYKLERSGDRGPWQLVEPTAAPADPTSLQLLTNLLARLRAERLVAESASSEDLGRFGLDDPSIQGFWWTGSSPSETPPRLEVGDLVPEGNGARFARLSDSPLIFSVGPDAVAILTAELRERRLLTFPSARANRVRFRWPDQRTLEFQKPETATVPGVSPIWRPTEGTEAPGLSPARIETIINTLADLTAVRFTQYEGPFKPETGLDPPRLVIEVGLQDNEEMARLRIGAPLEVEEGLVQAAIGEEDSGPVFLLPQAIFDIQPPAAEADQALPADPFAR